MRKWREISCFRESRAAPPILLSCLIAILLFVQIPTLATPIFWDEIFPYVSPALKIGARGWWHFLPGIYDSREGLGHPPAFFFLVSLVWRIGGESIEFLRAVMLAFSAASLWLTYRIGEKVDDALSGLLAAGILLSCPGFIARASHILPDTILVFFCLLAIDAAGRKSTGVFCLAVACFAALLKETTLAFLLPVTIYQLWYLRSDLTVRKIFFAVLPVVTFGFFFLLEKIITGNWTNFPLLSTAAQGLPDFVRNLTSHGDMFIFQSMAGTSPLLVLGGAGLVLGAQKEKIGAQHLLLTAVVLCYLGGVSLFNEINARYLSPAIPLLLVLAVTGLRMLFRSRLLVAAACALAILGARVDYYQILPGPRVGYTPDHSLGYVGHARRVKEIITDIEARFPQGSIATGWPYQFLLVEPRFGYGNSRRNVVAPGDVADFVLLATNMSPSQFSELSERKSGEDYVLDREYELPGGGFVKLFRTR